MPLSEKNWDLHVPDAESVARTPGFTDLRDRILFLAQPCDGDIAADVGAGTGLLSLPLAAQVERVFAIDISPAMCDYLQTKAVSGGHANLNVAVSTAASLPLVDGSVDLVVSNYCFHHLSDADKRRALAEAHRVLRPGGRLVFADMMFSVGLRQTRDRDVLVAKVRAMLAKGPGGVLRLARNGLRWATGRWEKPAGADWWRNALQRAGFVDVRIELCDHEGGIAFASKPNDEPRGGRS